MSRFFKGYEIKEKRTPKLYVYKEFCDGDAYGEEIIELFEDMEDAKKYLRERAEKHFKCPFDEIPEKEDFSKDDVFEDEYICYYTCDGYRFFIVDEKEVTPSSKEVREVGRRAIFELYDEPQKDILDQFHQSDLSKVKMNVVEASLIETTGRRHFTSTEDCEKKYCINKEISETEYRLYQDIQHITEEMFLHDLTGGFPRSDYVLQATDRIGRTVKKALDEFRKEKLKELTEGRQ